MFEPKVPVFEIILRVCLIYVFLLFVMRLFGKREIALLTRQELHGAVPRERRVARGREARLLRA